MAFVCGLRAGQDRVILGDRGRSMIVAAGRLIVGCWLGFVAAAAACKGGDAGTDSAEATSAASTSTSAMSTSSTGSTGGSTSTTGAPPTTLMEGGENGPPCPSGEVTPAELPIGAVGEPYVATITHGVAGDVGEVALLGMLPPGVEQSPGEGAINLSGTPTMAGAFPLSVSSSTWDGGTCLPEKDYVLVIADSGASTGSSTGMTGG